MVPIKSKSCHKSNEKKKNTVGGKNKQETAMKYTLFSFHGNVFIVLYAVFKGSSCQGLNIIRSSLYKSHIPQRMCNYM